MCCVVSYYIRQWVYWCGCHSVIEIVSMLKNDFAQILIRIFSFSFGRQDTMLAIQKIKSTWPLHYDTLLCVVNGNVGHGVAENVDDNKHTQNTL